jgi:hypothetical protein
MTSCDSAKKTELKTTTTKEETKYNYKYHHGKRLRLERFDRIVYLRRKNVREIGWIFVNDGGNSNDDKNPRVCIMNVETRCSNKCVFVARNKRTESKMEALWTKCKKISEKQAREKQASEKKAAKKI